MSRLYLQTKKTYLSYSISDTETAIQVDFIQNLDGESIVAADIGDLMYFTIDPGTNKEEICSVTSSDVTVNADGTVSMTVVRGLRGNSTYGTGGFKTFHGAGAIVVFSNNPQLYAQFGNIYNTNTWSLVQTFTLLPVSNGGNATDPTQLITYAQALALATGTASINRVVVAGTAGETLVAGNLIYLKESDGRWWKCDADTASTVENIILGIAQGAGTAGNAVTSGVLLFGLDSNQSGLTANSIGYAGNTAGAIVSTTPGTTEVTVGYSTTTTSILFYPRYNQMITEDIQDALAGNSGTPSGSNKYSTQLGLQRGQEEYGVDNSGSTTAYTVALSPVPVAYVAGQRLYAKLISANTTTTPTVNFNGLGALTVVKGVNTALAVGDIAATQFCEFIYDGTNLVLQNPATRTGAFVSAIQAVSTSSAGDNDVTISVPFLPSVITIYYSIKGLDSAGTVKNAKGIATYSGTTLTGTVKFVPDNTTTGTAVTSTNLIPATLDTTAPNAGDGPGSGNCIKLVMTVNSVSATQVVVRNVTTLNGTPGSPATNSFYIVAHP